MDETHTQKAAAGKTKEIRPDETLVRLPDGLRKAFGDLAVTVHFSKQFDSGMRAELEEMAAGHTRTVLDFVCTLPLIAQETFEHIHSKDDKRAAAAWSAICSELQERGFTLEKERGRGK